MLAIAESQRTTGDVLDDNGVWEFGVETEALSAKGDRGVEADLFAVLVIDCSVC